MNRVDPEWSVAVVVCCNQRRSKRSCGAERGEALRHRLRDWARAQGLKSQLVVHRGSCMDVCGEGTTVAMHGRGERRVFVVAPDETEALCAEIQRMVMH